MEQASGSAIENFDDITIKKESNIENDGYQSVFVNSLQIYTKQETCDDTKEDISNCEESNRSTNHANVKRENDTQCTYPGTCKKKKLLHQHFEGDHLEKPHTVFITTAPEIEHQKNSAESGQIIPTVDYNIVSIGDQQIPCISWSSQCYCLLRALKSIFISELSEDIINCAYIHPFSVFDLQNKFLIHIDIKLSDTTFTSEDEFISIEESHLYYNFLKTCSSKLSNNTKNSNKCGLIKMMDETIIPYVVHYNSKLLPLCYFKNRSDLQLDLNKIKIQTVSGWELSYLKFCCIVRGTASSELFESDACDAASLTDIAECFPLSIKFEDYWPRSDSEFELLTPSQDSPMLGSKKKCRQYNVEYLKYGFIQSPSNKTLPMCLICQRVFTNEAMKPSRLKGHFTKIHPDRKDTNISHFQMLKEQHLRQPTLVDINFTDRLVLDSKKTYRQYNVEYLKYGFIQSPSNKTLPMCLICQRVFSNGTMKSARLEEHLTKIHPDRKDKNLSYFQMLKDQHSKHLTLADVHFTDKPMSDPKKKCRHYNVEYLKYGFIQSPSNKTLPMCLVCQRVFSNEAMKPSRLKEHLTKIHPDRKDKNLSYFQMLKEHIA